MPEMIADAQINGTDCTILTLDIDHNSETVHTLGSSAPDPSWEHIDKAGHRHRWYGTELPTTVAREEVGWCEDCRDHHTRQGPERCIWCDEVVIPKNIYSGPQTVVVPGLMSLIASVAYLDLAIGQTALLTTSALSNEIVVVSQDTHHGKWLSRVEGVGPMLSREPYEHD